MGSCGVAGGAAPDITDIYQPSITIVM